MREAGWAKRSERKRPVGPRGAVKASPPGLLVSASVYEFTYIVIYVQTRIRFFTGSILLVGVTRFPFGGTVTQEAAAAFPFCTPVRLPASLRYSMQLYTAVTAT